MYSTVVEANCSLEPLKFTLKNEINVFFLPTNISKGLQKELLCKVLRESYKKRDLSVWMKITYIAYAFRTVSKCNSKRVPNPRGQCSFYGFGSGFNCDGLLNWVAFDSIIGVTK